MEIQLQKGNDGKAIFHPRDINELEIEQNQLVKIIDEDSSNFAVLTVIIDERAIKDTVLGDPNILSNLGIQNGTFIDVESYKGQIINANKVTIEFSTIDADPREFFQESHIRKLRGFLDSYYFVKTSELYWPEQYSTLRITIEEPFFQNGNVFRLGSSCDITLKEQVQTMPFNAILLIDKSQSMTRYDVKLEGIEDTLLDLKTRLIGDQEYFTNKYGSRNIYKNIALRELFNRLKPTSQYKETPIENPDGTWTVKRQKRGASRLDSVLFATILFFQLKISRGFGEKVAFVLYADDAKPIYIRNKLCIEASEFNAEICNELTKTIKDSNFMRYGNTNISSGLSCCRDIALDFKIKEKSKNPLMILLLTDGRPYPPSLDNNQRLLDSVYALKKDLSEHQIPFVIYTIGIGDALRDAETLLIRVAKVGNGEFHNAISVKILIDWYHKLANNFSLEITSDTRNRGI